MVVHSITLRDGSPCESIAIQALSNPTLARSALSSLTHMSSTHTPWKEGLRSQCIRIQAPIEADATATLRILQTSMVRLTLLILP